MPQRPELSNWDESDAHYCQRHDVTICAIGQQDGCRIVQLTEIAPKCPNTIKGHDYRL